jgi:hypothetical protein
VTDNTAHIQQMAATLATVASVPVATEEEIGAEGADQEGTFPGPPAEAAVSTIAVIDEPVSIDDGDADPASAIVIVDETIIDAGEPDRSSADTHGDTLDPADIPDPAPNDTGDDLGIEAPVSSEASKPAAPPAAATDIFSGFPAAPREPGEFELPLCDLVIGEISEGGSYYFDEGVGESLCHAVQAPETIAPIVVMKTADRWHVIDGWARVMAFRFQFGNTANVMVRVVEWDRTRDDALYKRFAQTFLTLKSRKIDKSLLLLEFYLTWNVPQLVLAARIGWTESRVTRELAAAEAMQEAPRFAELHVKAGDPPIDYLYQIQQARHAAAADDKAHSKRAPEKSAVGRLEAKLEALLAKSERFVTAEALAKLGIGKPAKEKATPQTADATGIIPALEAPEIIDCVEDSGGDAVAMIEIGADQFPSIRLLVDTATLDDRRKAEVRHLVHEALDRLLGF